MVIDAFDVGPQGTHIGVIYYSDKAHLVFDFNRYVRAQNQSHLGPTIKLSIYTIYITVSMSEPSQSLNQNKI